MFSLNRVYANAILPDGKDYTFWGRGVSQGHSDAIRRIEGRQGRAPVYLPGRGSCGIGPRRGESGADDPSEAHP